MVGPGDPMWTQDDRDKALWWAIHNAQRCPACGHRAEEFDPKQGGDLHAYEWYSAHCRGCEIAAQGTDWLEKHRKDVRRGTVIRMRPTRPEG